MACAPRSMLMALSGDVCHAVAAAIRKCVSAFVQIFSAATEPQALAQADATFFQSGFFLVLPCKCLFSRLGVLCVEEGERLLPVARVLSSSSSVRAASAPCRMHGGAKAGYSEEMIYHIWGDEIGKKCVSFGGSSHTFSLETAVVKKNR
jgi:hypothetical protein